MPTDANVNLNHADCLRSVSNFGETIVHNICNGAVNAIPWGGADWAVVCGFMAGGTVIVGLLSILAYRIATDS